jgi:hypothetical protein
MITKVYRLSVAMQAEINIDVNGQPITVQFKNGQFTGGQRRGGYCTITDPDIQEALEASEFFGPMYFLSKTSEVATKPKEQPKKPEVPVITVEKPDEAEHGVFYGITNSQKAKAKLLELFPDLTHAAFPNKDSVLAFAEKNEITFPDWEK